MKIITILNNDKIDNNELNNNDVDSNNVENNNINIYYYIQFALYFYLMCCIINYYLYNNNMGCISSNIFNTDSDEEQEKLNKEIEQIMNKNEKNLQDTNEDDREEINEDDREEINENELSEDEPSINYEELLHKNIYIECDKYDDSLLEKLITSYLTNDEHMNINNTYIKLYGNWNHENNIIFDNIFQEKFKNITFKTNNMELMIDIMEDVCLGHTSKVYILSSDGKLAYVLKKIKQNYPHVDVILPWRPYISKKIKEYVTNET